MLVRNLRTTVTSEIIKRKMKIFYITKEKKGKKKRIYMIKIVNSKVNPFYIKNLIDFFLISDEPEMSKTLMQIYNW